MHYSIRGLLLPIGRLPLIEMIRRLDCTLPTPEDNLALDVSLLRNIEESDDSCNPVEILRFWQSPQYFVVLGHSGRAVQEVHLEACKSASVPVLRRVSGGGPVLLGPGCLNFALALSLQTHPELREIRRSWRAILDALTRALGLPGVCAAGISDLVVAGKKFSGNAQRRTRHALLHQGTVLYDFDISRVSKFIKEPIQQPSYRALRSHGEFLCNLPLSVGQIKDRISQVWQSKTSPEPEQLDS